MPQPTNEQQMMAAALQGGVPYAPRPSPQELIDTPDPSNVIATLFKVRPPETSYVPPSAPPVYPTPSDVAFARKYDMTYGRPAAGIDTPGQRMGVMPGLDDVIAAYNKSEWNTKRQPMTQYDRDREYAAWLSTNRSPLASLGHTVGNMYTVQNPGDEYLAMKGGDQLQGFYSPKNDKMFYDIRNQEVIPHEATHRGMSILRQLGEPSVPRYGGDAEELMVRALMQRHYGGLEEQRAEHPQVRAGKIINYYYPQPLIKAEQAAQREIARRHPMGPN